MNQREWHSLLRKHALDDLREHWPDLALKGPWIVARNHGPFCWTVGWEVARSRGRRPVSNYAKIHIDFASSATSAVTDLTRTLGEVNRRQDYVHIPPDDPPGQAEAMAVLRNRIVDEAVPFFDQFPTAETMCTHIQQLIDTDELHPLDRLELVAGLTALNDPSAAAPWYDRALHLANEQLTYHDVHWLRDQAAWLERCLAAATGRTNETLTDMFAERGADYRSRGTLPARI